MSGSVDPRLFEYYESAFSEADRLTSREGQLEFVRTKELLIRTLPDPPARVLDVGGGTGAHATWLAALGYDVHLVDVVPAHVAAAKAVGGFTASVGDARSLEQEDDTQDVVLLLGPLYHLRSVEERAAALREAVRVVRPGGLVVAAFISRAAAALDGFVKGWLWERGSESMEQMTRFGTVDRDRSGFGVISYFHLPEDARSELVAAGLEGFELVGVEGPAWIAADFDQRWESEEGRALMLSAARAVEQVPELQVLSAHLLAFARCPKR